jgi:hypothetical protein
VVEAGVPSGPLRVTPALLVTAGGNRVADWPSEAYSTQVVPQLNGNQIRLFERWPAKPLRRSGLGVSSIRIRMSGVPVLSSFVSERQHEVSIASLASSGGSRQFCL